jgi:hypothetical protein
LQAVCRPRRARRQGHQPLHAAKQEFIRFFNVIEAEAPISKIVHMTVDTYATTISAVKAWLARHPRFVFLLTPKSCAWRNAVGTLSSRLTRRRPERGMLPELQAAINHTPRQTDADPKPIVWTAHPGSITAV